MNIGPSRVQLATWGDLVFAVDQGLLDETAYCELKKDLPPKSQNLEVARDLASLSVLGGVLVIGVRDAGKNQAGEVVGVEDPHSRMTRMVALAEGLVQPALVCDAWVVEDPNEDGRGCVVILVPPSATAPHRVDERYWGRTSEGKRVLSDPEVAELFAKRRHREDDFREHLVSLSKEFDPIPRDRRAHGHLYFSARPLQFNPAAQPPWGHDEHVLQLLSRAQIPRATHGWGDLTALGDSVSHPFGIMALSYGVRDGSIDREYQAAKLLVRDDAGIDFASGLGTVERGAGVGSGAVSVPVPAVVAYVDQCVRLTCFVAAEMALGGTWRLGVRLTKLLGAVSLTAHTTHRPATFPEGEYVAMTDTSASDLNKVEDVVERLMRPLARGFGEARLFPYQHPHELFRS